MSRRPTLPQLAYLSPLVAFVAIYVPAAGHGFIKDDISWIVTNRLRDLTDFVELFTRQTGFYRPVVAFTFSLNEWAFGSNPVGYGLTNVALALACFLAILGLVGH